jgi:hypothetical protein
MTMVEVIRARPAAVDGQEMAKGRRTEIEYLNGFVVREGEQVGIPARATSGSSTSSSASSAAN